jgi:hypothetical protein
MLTLDKLIEILMDCSKGSKPFLVLWFSIRSEFFALKIDSSEEVSERVLKFFRFLAAHEPDKDVYAVFDASKVGSDSSAWLSQFEKFGFVVLCNRHQELQI